MRALGAVGEETMKIKCCEERHLKAWDFCPFYSFYAGFCGRPKKLKKLGLEDVEVRQKGKLRQGTEMLNAYNFAQALVETLAGVYIANMYF
jgi:hypothetical protein